jgi:hypothetical protein
MTTAFAFLLLLYDVKNEANGLTSGLALPECCCVAMA